jgi:Tfp pilus assembly protein PilV
MMIEVVIGSFLFLFGLVGAMAVFSSVHQAFHQSHEALTAVHLAQEILEQTLDQPLSKITSASGTTSLTVMANGTPTQVRYDYTVSVAPFKAGGNMVDVLCTVTWTDGSVKRSVDLETLTGGKS